MKLLIAAGGTGGHVSPGLAVARAWLKSGKEREVLMAGGSRGPEKRMAHVEGLRFEKVPAWPLHRPLWDPRNFLLLPVLAAGVIAALSILGRERPAAVFATGAWVSMPYGLAAFLRRVPLIIHENDALPGLANRVLAPLARRITVGVEQAKKVFGYSAVVTGNPSRVSPPLPAKQKALKKFGLVGGRKTLLVMPGSGAAARINLALRQALPQLAKSDKHLQILWMCGPAEQDVCAMAAAESGMRVRVEPFIDDVASAYATADLVLCRAGASTLAELRALSLPALLVPYPFATGNHQWYNAMAVVEDGAAGLVADSDLDGNRLVLELRQLMKSKSLALITRAARKRAGVNSADGIVKTIESCLKG